MRISAAGDDLITAVQLCLGRETQTCLLQGASLREAIRTFCVEAGTAAEAVPLIGSRPFA
jgi:hypothetical protein